MKYLVVDIETGGFSKKKNGICEIAAVMLDESLNEISSFQTLIKPYPRSLDVQEFKDQLVSYKDDAMEVNGIDLAEMEAEGLHKEDVISQFYNFIFAEKNDGLNKNEDITIVGHNLENFDFPWLVEFFKGRLYKTVTGELECLTFEFQEMFKRIDTLRLCREWRGKGSKNDLPTLCEEFEINHESAHRAMGDVKATIELLKVLKNNQCF